MLNKSIIKAATTLLALALLKGDLLASDNHQHLLPTSGNFDTGRPYGKQYADLCEKLLFPASGWLMRYFQVIGEPAYDTGLTVYKKPKGTYRLMLKQAKPAIGDIVMNAYYGRLNLRSAIASIKIETSDRDIPDNVANELHGLWLALARTTRPLKSVDKAYYVHPAKVILWTKTSHGTVLSGKYPADAGRHHLFASVESIVDLLVKSCDAATQERARLLSDAANKAAALRATLEPR